MSEEAKLNELKRKAIKELQLREETPNGFDEQDAFSNMIDEIFDLGKSFGRSSALAEVENELPIIRMGASFSESHVDGQIYFKKRVNELISSKRGEDGK